jgi:hypothetical protein
LSEWEPGAISETNIGAQVLSRSTYSGGSVTGVTAGRQTLSLILAASAGVLLGAGTWTIVIKGGDVALTRITATTDHAGNRTAVTPSLPA